MKVILLYFDDCPSWQTTDRYLRQLAKEVDLDIDRHQVDTTGTEGVLRERAQ